MLNVSQTNMYVCVIINNIINKIIKMIKTIKIIKKLQLLLIINYIHKQNNAFLLSMIVNVFIMLNIV